MFGKRVKSGRQCSAVHAWRAILLESCVMAAAAAECGGGSGEQNKCRLPLQLAHGVGCVFNYKHAGIF